MELEFCYTKKWKWNYSREFFSVLKVFEGLDVILVKMKILESLLVLLFCNNVTVYYGLDKLIDDTNLGYLNWIVFVQYYIWINIILHRYIEYRRNDIILQFSYRNGNDFPLKLLSDFEFLEYCKHVYFILTYLCYRNWVLVLSSGFLLTFFGIFACYLYSFTSFILRLLSIFCFLFNLDKVKSIVWANGFFLRV